jgi:hypothetical protein
MTKLKTPTYILWSKDALVGSWVKTVEPAERLELPDLF